VLIAQEPQDVRLVLGHLPNPLIMFGVKGEYVGRRQVGPGEQAKHLGDSGVRQRCAPLTMQVDGLQHLVECLLQVVSVDQQGPGQSRGLKVVAHVAVRHCHHVHRATVLSRRAVPSQVALQHVPTVLRLPNGVDGLPHALMALLPNPISAAYVPTLDLDSGPAGTRDEHDNVCLVLVLPLLHAQAMEEHRLVGQLVPKNLPDCPLRTNALAEKRMGWNEDRHIALLPVGRLRSVHTGHLGHTGNTEQAKEKITMMGGSGFGMGAFGWLAMGVFLLVLVGLVVWVVARPRDRS